MADDLRLEKMEKNIEKILSISNGNGHDGILTKIALHEKKL